ncbi:DUF3592 domain-containing protein [Ruminococcus sp.]|uniref:DUF3592 domain-containing protein n=1 Tax=Ruminococcus sp. TaxID=41978 RepID=UPI0015B5AFCC|nr:DUF3592 domain-containing protein [uncultured Ruminococcus sp.]
MSDKIKLKAICILLILVGGIPCLYYWGSDLVHWIFSKNAQQTTGYVIDFQENVTSFGRYKKASDKIRTYTIVVKYKVDDKDYVRVVSDCPHGMSSNDPVKVYYKDSDPLNSVTELDMQKKPHIYCIAIFILGIVMFILEKKHLISISHRS